MVWEAPLHLTANPKDLQGLSDDQTEVVRKSLQAINDDPCDWRFDFWCTDSAAYEQAWNSLMAVPAVGLPLLLKTVRPRGDGRNDMLHKLLRENETAAVDYIGFANEPPGGALHLTRALLEYLRRNPGRDDQLGGAFAVLAPPLVRGGDCFSSASFEFRRQKTLFVESREADSYVGWEFLPLIEASLREGTCNDGEIVAVLNDLAHIGGPNVGDLLELVDERFRQETPAYARAFLKLALQIPYRRSLEEAVRRAIVVLIPSEERLIDRGLSWILTSLPREKRTAVVESIARERPEYREKLYDMTRLWLPVIPR